MTPVGAVAPRWLLSEYSVPDRTSLSLRRPTAVLMRIFPVFLPALLVLLVAAGPPVVSWAAEPVLLAPAPIATLLAEPMSEISGLVRSPGRSGVIWAHNDSGDSARLFAITPLGESILPTYSRFTAFGDTPEAGKEQWQGFPVLNASHVDWEDIAADEHYLYIADTGNNSNDRRDLGIYLVSEIDPTASTRSAVIQHLPVYYPEQQAFPPADRHFDSESLFTFAGKLYLITKHRGGGVTGLDFAPGAYLYRLDTRSTETPNALQRIDSHPAILAATGADVSPDGSRLAVTAQDALWLFERPASGDLWLSAPGSRYPFDRRVLKQLEAVTWLDNDTLLLANEQRDLFRVRLADLPAPTAP